MSGNDPSTQLKAFAAWNNQSASTLYIDSVDLKGRQPEIMWAVRQSKYFLASDWLGLWNGNNGQYNMEKRHGIVQFHHCLVWFLLQRKNWNVMAIN